MKHIFIVNPAAGGGAAMRAIAGQLEALGGSYDAELYATKCRNDAQEYIKSWCGKNHSPVRFIACGGDGTVNEIVNGAVNFKNAEFGVYACGSGNDFVKCFGGQKNFLDVRDIVSGESREIDLIRVGERYCVNVCHFGFDTCVARTMNNVKNKPIIGGKNAYTTGVANALIRAMRNKAQIIVDGERVDSGEFLLCTLGNGQYVGGKYRCAPHALVDDGLMEFCLVDPVSRFTFLKLVGSYAEGRHLDDKRFSTFVHYRQCKKVEIIADEDFSVSVDGEVTPAPHVTVELLPKAIRFVLPKSIEKDYLNGKNTASVQ